MASLRIPFENLNKIPPQPFWVRLSIFGPPCSNPSPNFLTVQILMRVHAKGRTGVSWSLGGVNTPLGVWIKHCYRFSPRLATNHPRDHPTTQPKTNQTCVAIGPVCNTMYCTLYLKTTIIEIYKSCSSYKRRHVVNIITHRKQQKLKRWYYSAAH